MKLLLALIALSALSACATVEEGPAAEPRTHPSNMELGAFSISLTVKDLGASRAFYEKLGFTIIMGDAEQNWLVLRNGDHVIGLFHGMFPRNMLTFNPGWTQQAEPLGTFQDVRELQARLEASGLELDVRADPASTGVAHVMLTDPDGNPILIDQHVPKPR